MRKEILNVALLIILLVIVMIGMINLTEEEVIKEYGLAQKLLLAAPPNEWETNQIEQEYGIPMYNGQILYCAGAGTRIRDVGSISYYEAKKWVGTYSTKKSLGVYDGQLTYVVYKYTGGGALSPEQAYIISAGGNSNWSEEKQHALWNLSGSSGAVHDHNNMKAEGAQLAAEAKLYATYHSAASGWSSVSGSGSQATVKVNQSAKEYIVGPFTVNYVKEAKQDGITFGGISNMKLNGGAIGITGLIIDGKRQAPEYFTPDGEMVDRGERFYPESGQEFYVVFSDPNANGGGVTEVALTVEFQYMLANGEYRTYNGTQYKVDISYYNTDGKKGYDEKVVSLVKASTAPQPAMWAEAERELHKVEIGFEPIDITIKLGGYVWEDGKEGKESNADGSRTTFENVDKPLPNIRVMLSDGQETRTGEDGGYKFENLDAMKKYTVSFEYNGQIYLPTDYMVEGVAWENSSKGLEKQKEREAFDKKFAEIGSSPNNYGENKRTFTKLELMGYELGEDGKYRKTGVQLIDGYEYDENGFETDNYTLAEKNPNTSDPEIAEKLQFIKDCQIKSYTDEYPDVDPFVIGNSDETVAGTKYTALYDRIFYINQGLWRRQEYDAALRKDVYRAALKINDKTVIYKYDKRTDDEKYWDINIRMSDYEAYYNSGYNRELYRSDYEYEPMEEHTGSPLEIYVTYKITVRNQSMSIMSQIKEVVDYYDKEYTYMENLSWVTYKDGDKDNSVSDEEYYNAVDAESIESIKNARPVKSSNTSKYGEDTHSNLYTSGNYGSIYIKGLENKKLSTGESAYIYLTFKVNKENGKVILDDENSSKQNFAEINGYATFYKDGTKLPNDVEKNSKNTAGLIDIDSNPGNLSLQDINNNEKYEKNFEDDTDRAKGLRILIDEDAIRKANGIVWEDKRNNPSDKATIGDGIRDDSKEEKVAGVTVELVEKMAEGKEYTWQKTTTNSDGFYEFSGYIPGDYVIRFYYGDSTYTVESTKNGGLNDISYNGQDFKSTTYQVGMTQNDITNDYETDESKQYKGYKQVDSQNESGTYGYDIYTADVYDKNVSDAKDIWSRRENVIKYSNSNVTNHIAEVLASPYETPTYNGTEYEDERKSLINELITNTYMVAETGVIAVEFEYNRHETDGEKVSNGENNYLYGNDINGEYTLNNIDFGLVERPKAQLEINKSISNVRVTLANGTVLFDVNKGNKVDDFIWRENSPYKLDSKKDKNGLYSYIYRQEVTEKVVEKNNNGLIQITMDEELMHGATVQVTYKVKVTNVSEVDYEGQSFYYSGTNPGNTVTTTANEVIDYVSNNLKFDGSNSENTNNWKIINKAELTNNQEVTKNLVNSHLTDNINKFNNIIETTSFDGYKLEPGVSTPEVTLILNQLITTENSSDDLSYENIVEIVKTSNTVGRRMAYSVVGNQNPEAVRPDELDASMAETVIILPPFGQMYIYYILGAVISIILIGGIVFIRKKVLKK